jgi:hypothetical protein
MLMARGMGKKMAITGIRRVPSPNPVKKERAELRKAER